MKVSVITVTLNCGTTVERTIQSVLEQRGVDFEYIVVDGASSDDTLDILQRYKSQFAALVSEPDHGIYDAMNKAILLSNGGYLLFMNAGDIFADRQSLLQLASMIDKEAVEEQVVCGGWLVQTKRGLIVSKIPDLPRGLFNHQAILYSRSIHAWHGRYVCAQGLSAADFLFFRTLQASSRVTFHATGRAVAVIDPFGISAGLQTYLQRTLVNMLCGFEGRYLGAAKLVIHPTYNRLKRLFTRQ